MVHLHSRALDAPQWIRESLRSHQFFFVLTVGYVVCNALKWDSTISFGASMCNTLIAIFRLKSVAITVNAYRPASVTHVSVTHVEREQSHDCFSGKSN